MNNASTLKRVLVFFILEFFLYIEKMVFI